MKLLTTIDGATCSGRPGPPEDNTPEAGVHGWGFCSPKDDPPALPSCGHQTTTEMCNLETQPPGGAVQMSLSVQEGGAVEVNSPPPGK